MFFFKKRSLIGMYMFCIFVIISKSIVLKERIELHQAKKIVLYLLYYFWEKNTVIKNMCKTRKKSRKNHVDSCYYAMLLGRSVH